MNPRKTKGLLVCLVLVMLLSLFASCKSNGKPGATTEPDTSSIDNSSDSQFDANGYLKDDLPGTYDFDQEFIIYSWQDQKAWEWVASGTTAKTTLEKALYARQKNVEKRFGVDISLVYAPGSWDDRNSFIQTLASHVNVNDHAYDLVGQYTASGGVGATQGLYQDLVTVDWINLQKPWWPSKISNSASVGENLFFLTGDITPTLIRNVECMFVNTDLYEAYDLAQYSDGKTIYDVVKDHEWTLEKLEELALNHVDADSGMYGLSILNAMMADGFLYSGGFTMVENNNGVMSVSPALSSLPMSNWFDKVQELFAGRYEDVVINNVNPFKEYKSIFYCGNVSDAENFSKDGINFAILPMPKQNTEQSEYYTCASFWVTVYSIPTDVRNPEMSGMILEALASEAYRTVTDEIYFGLFQTRFSGDDSQDYADMMDIVSDSVVFDSSRMFADALKMFSKFRNAVNDSSRSWSTEYAANIDTWRANVADIYEKVK